MQEIQLPSPAVVVGIDGSRAALTAALWAADEAFDRDIPLRLVYAIEPGARAPEDPECVARRLAAAEIAVKHAIIAVESIGKPIKLEVEILQDRPSRALVRASASAAMICVGALGFSNSTGGRVGSTAAVVAGAAHCPVAIIRGYDGRRRGAGAVVAEIDSSPESDDVLGRAVAEALLRGVELHVVSAWQSRCTDVHDSVAATERSRKVRADLDRRMMWVERNHPELRVQTVAVHGTFIDYLTRHAASTQLVVVGRRRVHGSTEIVGPRGYAALKDSECSVLVCDPHGAL